MLPNDSADIPTGATNTTTPMSDLTEPCDWDRETIESLKRTLLESQAALAKFQAEQRAERALNQASRDSIDRLFAEYDAKLATSQAALAAAREERASAEAVALARHGTISALRADLAAANARIEAFRASVADTFVPSTAELVDLRADLATARAEAEALRRERDEARTLLTDAQWRMFGAASPGWACAVGPTRERTDALVESIKLRRNADEETARESVRELVDGLATAKDSMLDGAAAVQRLILLHGSSAKAETLAARMRTKASEIDTLLAKHAAPAPTPAEVPWCCGGNDQQTHHTMDCTERAGEPIAPPPADTKENT